MGNRVDTICWLMLVDCGVLLADETVWLEQVNLLNCERMNLAKSSKNLDFAFCERIPAVCLLEELGAD